MSSVTLRVVHINDVYEIDQFPYLKTLFDEVRAGCDRLIVTLGGDFVAPSLLSGIDHGKGMVNVMSATGVSHVCFGNHENDIPFNSLINRVKEFTTRGGVWINSNMKEFSYPLPEFVTETVVSKDGKHQRKIAILGLLCHYPSLYRSDSFNGAVSSIVPVNQSAAEWHTRLSPTHDLILPMTHQGIEDDIILAKTGLFPFILGAHDHQEYYVTHGNSTLVKTGSDAHKCVVVDFVWSTPGSTEPPRVTWAVKSAREGRIADPVVLREVKLHLSKVEAMELAILYYHDNSKGFLTSRGMRQKTTTMGTLVCTCCRESLRCDAVFLDAGCIRGNQDYPNGKLSLSSIKKEIPFPTDIGCVRIIGKVISEMVQYSRRGEGVSEQAGYLQADDGVHVDGSNMVTHIGEKPLDPNKEYEVGLLLTTMTGMNNNIPLINWLKGRTIPPEDSGQPGKALMLSALCSKLWKKLPSFDEIDLDKNGLLSQEEVATAYAKVFPLDLDGNGVVDAVEMEAARIVVKSLIDALNKNDDDMIDREEYANLPR